MLLKGSFDMSVISAQDRNNGEWVSKYASKLVSDWSTWKKEISSQIFPVKCTPNSVWLPNYHVSEDT